MTELDQTHDPNASSWVPGADGHADFPVQNLPLGIFSPPGGGKRGGIAIGDFILDLWNTGFKTLGRLGDYLLLGAAIVVPVFIVIRLLSYRR